LCAAFVPSSSPAATILPRRRDRLPAPRRPLVAQGGPVGRRIGLVAIVLVGERRFAEDRAETALPPPLDADDVTQCAAVAGTRGRAGGTPPYPLIARFAARDQVGVGQFACRTFDEEHREEVARRRHGGDPLSRYCARPRAAIGQTASTTPPRVAM